MRFKPSKTSKMLKKINRSITALFLNIFGNFFAYEASEFEPGWTSQFISTKYELLSTKYELLGVI